MKKTRKNKKITIDKLAIMMNNSFDGLDKKIDKEIGEVKESIKDVRKDIFNLGDRFVSYHTFDALANRVKILEEKKK